jgi:hypothetical protein
MQEFQLRKGLTPKGNATLLQIFTLIIKPALASHSIGP